MIGCLSGVRVTAHGFFDKFVMRDLPLYPSAIIRAFAER